MKNLSSKLINCPEMFNNWFEFEDNDASKEIYISIPGDKGFLAWQRKVRYKRRNCPLYLYSKESLEQYLKDAGCLEMTEIVDTERGYYLIIRK